jgi:hypothetical protein
VNSGGNVTVCVTVLVLVLVLTVVLVLVLGGAVVVGAVVVVGSVVVVVSVVDGVVSVADCCVDGVDGDTVDADVLVIGVRLLVVVDPGDESPDTSATIAHTINATRTAPIAPNATSAAGLRYQGTGSGSGGGAAGSPYPP